MLTKVYIEVWNPDLEGFDKGFAEFDPEEDFKINEADIDIALCKHGQVMVEYGDRMAETKAMLARKEEFVKYVHAKTAQTIRQEAEENNVKLTEGKVHEQVTISPEYQAALGELNRCRADAMKCDNYWRIAVKEADLLTSLAYKTGQEIKKMMGS